MNDPKFITMPAIILNNIAKSFPTFFGPKKQFIKGLSLSIDEGTIAVLIGPNGSGKTTLIKLILSLLYTDEGRIKVLQSDMQDMNVRRVVGYLPEMPRFPGFLTAEAFLGCVCELNDMPTSTINNAVQTVLKKVELWEERSMPIRKYSKGMRKRLGIAQAIVNDPKVLILDEPLDGLDPCGVHMFSVIMKDMRAKGKTVFLTTHLLSQIEEYADKVAIINQGTIVFESLMSKLPDTSLTDLYMRFVK
jgi:ABC-2 type transport system ATP-binding protein